MLSAYEWGSVLEAWKEKYPDPAGLTLGQLIKTSTDLAPEQYFHHMRAFSLEGKATRLQWGGFLEAAIVCHRWKVRAHIFEETPAGLQHLSSFGQLFNPDQEPYVLIYTGVHYNVAVLTKAGLEKVMAIE